MGFYAPAQLISDARRHQVTVRPVDVNFSHWGCTLERTSSGQLALRLGFRMINGISARDIEQLCAARDRQMFYSFDDFRHRTGMSSASLSRLSQADAFRSVRMNRRQALWHSLPDQTQQPLLDELPADDSVRLPLMSEQQQVIADYNTTGLSLRAHPLAAHRSALKQRGIVTAAELASLEDDCRVRVAGLVLIRQHPGTARGVTFVTLEDETGTINLIVQPNVWNRFRQIARTSAALYARGQLQHQHNVIHVLVDWLEDLSTTVRNTNLRSRDFR
jgi:error-prone DNA polymerase